MLSSDPIRTSGVGFDASHCILFRKRISSGLRTGWTSQQMGLFRRPARPRPSPLDGVLVSSSLLQLLEAHQPEPPAVDAGGEPVASPLAQRLLASDQYRAPTPAHATAADRTPTCPQSGPGRSHERLVGQLGGAASRHSCAQADSPWCIHIGASFEEVPARVFAQLQRKPTPSGMDQDGERDHRKSPPGSSGVAWNLLITILSRTLHQEFARRMGRVKSYRQLARLRKAASIRNSSVVPLILSQGTTEILTSDFIRLSMIRLGMYGYRRSYSVRSLIVVHDVMSG